MSVDEDNTPSPGDYVEIVGNHKDAGKRGYYVNGVQERGVGGIKLVIAGESAAFTDAHVVLDVFRGFDTIERGGSNRERYERAMATLVEPTTVPKSCLKVVRKQNVVVTTNVCDFHMNEEPCLGIAASSCKTSKIDPESSHGKLARVAAKDLPGLHAGHATFKKRVTESLVRKIYRGDFTVEWKHTFESPNAELSKDLLACGCPTLIIKVLVRRDDKEPRLFHMGTLHLVTPDTRIEGSWTKSWDWLPELALTLDQRNVLAKRVVHQLFRVVGYDVGYRALYTNWDMLDAYKGFGYWNEYLDSILMWSDLMLQMEQPQGCLIFAFTALGEALEACDKFGEAALIYQQMADKHALGRPANEELIKAYNCAALALKRNGDYATSEEVYLRAAREMFTYHGSDTCRLSLFNTIGRNMVAMYADKADVEFVATGTTNLLEVGSLIGAMMDAAAGEGSVLLADKYQPTSFIGTQAMRALHSAFLAKDAASFRSIVRTWKRDEVEVEFNGSKAEGSTLLRQQALQNARKFLQCHVGTSRGRCYNKACRHNTIAGMIETTRLKRCTQCESVFYCSVKCQKADWKEHKPRCIEVKNN